MNSDNSLVSRAGCLPYNPKLKNRSRELRRNMTEAENIIWSKLLRNHNYLFHRQKIIHHYIVDFYCSKLKLVIEIDGEIHDGNDNIEYDKNRTEILNGLDLTVMRFKNKEIYNEFEKCIKYIDEYIKNFEGKDNF